MEVDGQDPSYTEFAKSIRVFCKAIKTETLTNAAGILIPKLPRTFAPSVKQERIEMGPNRSLLYRNYLGY